MGAQLIVRPGQGAVFVNEGRIADTFAPGRHTLATGNMPILTKLLSWKYGLKSPFKTEVYLVSSRQFTDQKWGTQNPVMVQDPRRCPLRLPPSASILSK
jgi:membrane protease subunit (stomatin/prohibitin family)